MHYYEAIKASPHNPDDSHDACPITQKRCNFVAFITVIVLRVEAARQRIPNPIPTPVSLPFTPESSHTHHTVSCFVSDHDRRQIARLRQHFIFPIYTVRPHPHLLLFGPTSYIFSFFINMPCVFFLISAWS